MIFFIFNINHFFTQLNDTILIFLLLKSRTSTYFCRIDLLK